LTFVKTGTVYLAGVENLWHPVKLNKLDFTQQDRVRQRVHISTIPNSTTANPYLPNLLFGLGKSATWRLRRAAYQWINNSGIGPKILGHLTEGKDGRVVGIVVTEWVQGARATGPGEHRGLQEGFVAIA
jgi:hypothetical protein